jgi:hypothetical protein
MKYFPLHRFLLVFLWLLCFVSVEAAELPDSIATYLKGYNYDVESVNKFQDFRVIIANHSSQIESIVNNNGKWLFIFQGKRLALKKKAPDDDKFYRWFKDRIQIGMDVTGRGKPNVVLTTSTGGAHCCYELQIYELSAHPRQIASIYKANDSSPAQFHVSTQGLPVIRTYDWALEVRIFTFGGTPKESVFLRFDGKRYAMANDLMRWDAKIEAPAIWRIDPILACQIHCPKTGVEAEWEKKRQKDIAEEQENFPDWLKIDLRVDSGLLCKAYCSETEQTRPALAEWKRQRQQYIEDMRKSFLENSDSSDADAKLAPLAQLITPLVYGGDMKGAEKLVKRIWLHNVPAQKAFWRAYLQSMRNDGQYWADLQRAYPMINTLGSNVRGH